MSFPPPRPPMGMPPMPPGMGYNYGPPPPIGMMPYMPHGMPPRPMMRPPGTGPTSESKQEAAEKKDDGKSPVTTVFVGNISDRAPDAMIRTMLQRCGNVLTWKRVQGASGKLQAFGFCEYEQPEATLRAIRLLHDWEIPDKKLVVKVDAKTKILLEDYLKKKKKLQDKESDSEKAEEGEIDESEKTVQNQDIARLNLDEFTLREDRVAKAGLDAIMREYAADLSKEPPKEAEPKKQDLRIKIKEKKDEGIDNMDITEEAKDLINREISKFRDSHKGEEEPDDIAARRAEERRQWMEQRKEREKKLREAERDREKERERERARERDRAREREKEREREREKSRERERDRDRRREHRRARDSRPRSRERDRDRDRDRERDRDRHSASREIIDEEEEEEIERKRLERKLKDKEIAYQERLKVWEARERKKMREYEKEERKERDRKDDESREARRLKEFLEDYDDERDDPKFYKGSALQRRMKEREKEMEADARDRQREKEELDEIRRQLEEEGHADVEEQMARIERERDAHLMPRLKQDSSPEPEPDHLKQEFNNVDSNLVNGSQYPPQRLSRSQSQSSSSDGGGGTPVSVQSTSPRPGAVDHLDGRSISASVEDSTSMQFLDSTSISEEHAAAKMGFSGLKLGSSDSPGDSSLHLAHKRKKLTVGDVFNQDEDNDVGDSKKRKLVPFDMDDEDPSKAAPVSLAASLPSTKPITAEEKRRCIKTLIERIPTAKEELFAYSLDWNMVDDALMERRIKPWVNKKIVEYIGEEEAQLTEFICQKVMMHSTPQVILDDVAMVLDEESEVFVVKMWRLLIYETEAKKAGLVK